MIPVGDSLTVTEWVRYGHDRLYAHTADGTRLRRWHNKGDQLALEAGADEESVRAALARYGDVASVAAEECRGSAAERPLMPPSGRSCGVTITRDGCAA